MVPLERIGLSFTVPQTVVLPLDDSHPTKDFNSNRRGRTQTNFFSTYFLSYFFYYFYFKPYYQGWKVVGQSESNPDSWYHKPLSYHWTIVTPLGSFSLWTVSSFPFSARSGTIRWLFLNVFHWCPRQESNLHQGLRRPLLYPLSYEDSRNSAVVLPGWV